MLYRLFKILGITVIFSMLLLVSLASGADIRNAQTTFGVKGGVSGSAIYYTNEREFESSMGYSACVFVDYKLGPRFLGGLSLNMHGISDVYETNVTLLDISVIMKAMVYSEGSNITFRPFFGIGYGSLGDYGFDVSDHLLLKGGLELVISSGNGISYLGEIMLLGSVDGGNDLVPITFGPSLYIRGGLIF